jgi:hypothetical protein
MRSERAARAFFVILVTALMAVADILPTTHREEWNMAALIRITRIRLASIRRRYRWYEIDGACL